MNVGTCIFEICGKKVIVRGYPELENCTGVLDVEGMVFFFGKKGELYIANTTTGKIRKFSANGYLLVDDDDIDYDTIADRCIHGLQNAQNKIIRYEGINRWDGFKDGFCAISWMLYPDGRYFSDGDGFGMEDIDEEIVYAVIDTNLDIIVPFRPINNIAAYLKEFRKP